MQHTGKQLIYKEKAFKTEASLSEPSQKLKFQYDNISLVPEPVLKMWFNRQNNMK